MAAPLVFCPGRRQVVGTSLSNLSVKIGHLVVEPALVLAPMAGVTNAPFRLLAKEQGCRLVISEMISARGLLYNQPRSRLLYYFTEAERPVGLQLFGHDPQVMASAAARLEALRPDFIDLNLGCPTHKVIKNGDGGALLRNPALVSKIFKAVKKAVSCPVTVKLRAGFDESSVNAEEIAQRAEEAGLAMVTVHGRTVSQKYSAQADWDIVARVKAAVKIPVIGNGDIVSAKDALAMINHCSCDGVMIGRAARGNPWLFAEVLAALSGRPHPPKPTAEEMLQAVVRHFTLLGELKGEEVAVREMRRHCSWYIKGSSRAAEARRLLVRVKTQAEAQTILENLLLG